MREPELKGDVAALDKAKLAKPLSECIEERGPVAVCRRQNADSRDIGLRLLTKRRFGRDKQSEGSTDESPPVHSITSSAGEDRWRDRQAEFFGGL